MREQVAFGMSETGERRTTKPRWHEAVSFACRAHAGQTRRDGRTPYVAHVIRVAMTLRDEFGCADEVRPKWVDSRASLITFAT